MPESVLLDVPLGYADSRLSPLERRLLLHLAHGVPRGALTSAENLTLAVVDRHLTALYAVLGAESATAAVIAGHVQGLLPRERYRAPGLPAGLQSVLDLVGQRLSDREIGARLGLTHSVARRPVEAVYAELGASNRPSACHIAYCTGLLGRDLT
jgi:DNA-binding CsgD family transcriptional regulator